MAKTVKKISSDPACVLMTIVAQQQQLGHKSMKKKCCKKYKKKGKSCKGCPKVLA